MYFIYLIRMLAYLFVRIVIAIRFGVKTLANGKISAGRMLDRRVGHVVWVIIEKLVRHAWITIRRFRYQTHPRWHGWIPLGSGCWIVSIHVRICWNRWVFNLLVLNKVRWCHRMGHRMGHWMGHRLGYWMHGTHSGWIVIGLRVVVVPVVGADCVGIFEWLVRMRGPITGWIVALCYWNVVTRWVAAAHTTFRWYGRTGWTIGRTG